MGTAETQTGAFNERDIESCKLIARFTSPLGSYNWNNKNGLETWRCAWAPDNSYIAWSCGKGLVKVIPWNKEKNCVLADDDRDISGSPIKHERKIRTFSAGELVFSVAFGCKDDFMNQIKNLSVAATTRYRYKTVNDLILAVGLKGGRIRTWNVRTGNVFLVLMDHTALVQDLQFAPDSSLRLLSASRDGTLKLWHLDDDGNMSRTFYGKASQNLLACCWAPNCRMVCGVGTHRGVHIWDMETYEQRLLKGHVNNVCGCAFSPDSVLLATASYDTTVILWNAQSGQKLCKLYHLNPPPKEWMVGGANSSYVRFLSFSSIGRHISTVCEDDTLRVWDILDPSHPQEMADAPEALCCSFSATGTAIAVGNREGTLTIWGAPRNSINLQQLCRTAFQRALSSNGLTDSQRAIFMGSVPPPLQAFLKYADLLQQP